MTAFEELGMLPELARAVDDMDWTLPTDVQAEAIPAILGGGDVLMAAETGSGKTGAFCLPLLQIVWESLKDIQSGRTRKTPSKSQQKQRMSYTGNIDIIDIDVKWALNVYDRGDALAIADDGLLCQSRDPQQWHGSRATYGVTGKGKYYYEATVTDDGLCRIGWSTPTASLDLGTDRYGFGYGGTGKKSNDKQFDSYGESFTLHDTIGCMLDRDRNQITFSKNGTIFPTAFEIPKHLAHSPMFPAVVLKNAEIRFNFGDSEFKYPPPTDYVAVNMAESTAGASSATARKEVPAAASNAPMCVIIEPTRELAEQTHNQINKFKKYLDAPTIRNVLVVGSVPIKNQLDEINDGVDIITATPGRIEDFISTGKLSLSNVRFYILDEADSLVNPSNGCVRLIDNIHRLIPKTSADGNRLQMIVCSATLHNHDVKKMADRLMHFPQWVDLKGQDSVPDTVHHVVVPIDPKADRRWMRLQEHVATDGVHLADDIRPGSNAPETLSEAVKVLKGEYVLKAIQEHKMDRCLIFCRTKVDCDNLEVYLRKTSKEHTCVCLHSDRKPEERQQNLQQFKDGKVKFLICTDVAARGIDIHGMPFVINVTLPDEAASYLHRIGRVGRADRMGLAISLVSTVPEKVWYHSCASRGKNCNNSKLMSQGGCAIWYDEQALLIDVEEHLGSTIALVDTDIKVPIDEFDGRVVYGAKKMGGGIGYKGHAVSLASTVKELAELERTVQLSYLNVRKFRPTMM